MVQAQNPRLRTPMRPPFRRSPLQRRVSRSRAVLIASVELDGLQHLELEAHQHHVDHHHVEARGPGAQDAAAVAPPPPASRPRARSARRPPPWARAAGRRRAWRTRARRRPRETYAARSSAGGCAGREARAVGRPGGDAVDPEGAPVVAVGVPGDQVPAPAGDQAVRLHRAAGWWRRRGRGSRSAAARGRGRRRRGRSGRSGRRWGRRCAGRDGDRLQGVDAVAQPGRQHLLQLGQGPQRGLLDPGDRTARRPCAGRPPRRPPRRRPGAAGAGRRPRLAGSRRRPGWRAPDSRGRAGARRRCGPSGGDPRGGRPGRRRSSRGGSAAARAAAAGGPRSPTWLSKSAIRARTEAVLTGS